MFSRNPSGAPPRRIARRCEGTKRKDLEEGRGRRWPWRKKGVLCIQENIQKNEDGEERERGGGDKKRWGIYAAHIRDTEWGGIRIAAIPMGKKEMENKGRRGIGQGGRGDRGREREEDSPSYRMGHW